MCKQQLRLIERRIEIATRLGYVGSRPSDGEATVSSYSSDEM